MTKLPPLGGIFVMSPAAKITSACVSAKAVQMAAASRFGLKEERMTRTFVINGVITYE
jgi:hypothetical protein